jgi:hypothetical protein
MINFFRRFIVISAVLLMIQPAHAQETILELKERIIELQNQGELGFRNFTLCTNIIGYGQYVPSQKPGAEPGSKIFFYYEPVNLFTNRRNGSYQIWFTQDMVLFSETGEELLRADDALNFNYLTTSPVLDVYASNTLELGDLPPGKYRFQAVIHDKLRNADAEYTLVFEIFPP